MVFAEMDAPKIAQQTLCAIFVRGTLISAWLVRFAALTRILECSQGASGRESPDRPAAEISRREISVSRPDYLV